MNEPVAVSQQPTSSAPENTPAVPLLYLSSADAGWEGLRAEAFHEPKELEGWIATAQPDITLVLFAGGAMRIEQRQEYGSWQTRHLLAGDLMLRPGGGPSYEVRWQGLTAEPTRTLHLYVSQSLVARTAEEVADCGSDRLALAGRSGFQDPLLAQIGFALWRELEQGAPAGKLYAQTVAQLLAVHLLRHYTAEGAAIKEPSRGLTQRQMRRVIDFIEAHLDQDLSLESLAQQTGFSSYHFARLFRQTTGASPHQYVLRQRIERAQRLLKETDAPLAEIALQSGFANQSHLTRVFKEHSGLTPRAYRQER